MTIRFSEDDVRPMGRATAGVRGMKLRSETDAVVSCDVARDDAVSAVSLPAKKAESKRQTATTTRPSQSWAAIILS